MSLSSALSLAKVIPWGCDVERDVFYCDYDAYHPDHAPEPDGHGCYVVPMERYFAGVHPDYRQEAIRMIAELKEGKRTEFHETYMVHWFNEREPPPQKCGRETRFADRFGPTYYRAERNRTGVTEG